MSDKRILIAAAVSQELQHFKKTEAASHCDLLVTGMGRGAARAVARRLRSKKYSLLISTGFAGALQPGYKIGDLVVAREVVEAASAESQPSDWSSLGFNGTYPVGSFLTVGRPLAGILDKSQAGIRFGALAVDMESAWVARAAVQAGVPWIGIRVILDPLEEPLWPGFGWARFMRNLTAASRSLSNGLNHVVKGEIGHGSDQSR